LPHQRAAYAKYHDRGFEILSVSLDDPKSKTPEALRAWTAENGMVWRHVYDGNAFDSPLAKAFFVQGVPAPFLIGRDGSLEAIDEECRGDKLDGAIEKALLKKGI
jgi:hypothetical protein